jgi:hypothetical protein
MRRNNVAPLQRVKNYGLFVKITNVCTIPYICVQSFSDTPYPNTALYFGVLVYIIQYKFILVNSFID